MTTDPANLDDTGGTEDVSDTIDIRPWKLIQKHGLKLEQPQPMDPEEFVTFRDRFAKAIGSYATPLGTPLESRAGLFEESFEIPLDRLTDGYFERRTHGVEIVFYGTNADQKTVWLVLAIAFDGSMSISHKTEVLPGDADHSSQA